jgi:hypothetical protein
MRRLIGTGFNDGDPIAPWHGQEDSDRVAFTSAAAVYSSFAGGKQWRFLRGISRKLC